MKKIKMAIVAAMFCAAAFAGYTAYDKATMTDAERMMLANLEALTDPETTYNNAIEISAVCSKCGKSHPACMWDQRAIITIVHKYRVIVINLLFK